MEVFLGGSVGKEFACNEEDPRSIPGSGRSPGEGFHGQRSLAGYTVHGITRVRHDLATKPTSVLWKKEKKRGWKTQNKEKKNKGRCKKLETSSNTSGHLQL